MKIEQLREIGLTDDQANSVMALKGKYFSELEQRVEKAETELQTSKDQLAEVTKDRDAQLEKLKSANPDELKSQIEKLQEENQSQAAIFQEKLDAANKQNAIMLALKGRVHDTGIVLRELNQDMISIVDGKIQGLEDQVAALEESKAFLFIQDEAPAGTGGSIGNKNRDAKPDTITKEQFEKMPYKDRVALYKENKELFDKLQGE